MTSQPTQRESILPRVLKWLYLSAFLLLIVSIPLRAGIADRFGLQTISYFIYRAPLALLFVVVVLDGRVRRGPVPTIALLVGGVLLLSFSILPRLWLLIPSVMVLGLGATFVVWPQLREICHRLSSSYREISTSSKL